MARNSSCEFNQTIDVMEDFIYNQVSNMRLVVIPSICFPDKKRRDL